MSLIEELPTLASQPLPHIPPSPAKKPQPEWDLSKHGPVEPVYDGPDEGDETPGIDCLAFYVPAHNLDCEEYGVHFLKPGIARLTDDIQRLCPDQPVEVLTMASIFLLLGHEVCHGWLEDLCCLMDFSSGTPNSVRRYAEIQRRWTLPIRMEEALCNTAAWGWLYEFLNANDCQDTPRYDRAKILGAFYRWLRCSPPGYRDFLPIRCAPTESTNFFANTCLLLEKVYGYESSSLPDVDTLKMHHPPGFAIFHGPHVPLHLDP